MKKILGFLGLLLLSTQVTFATNTSYPCTDVQYQSLIQKYGVAEKISQLNAYTQQLNMLGDQLQNLIESTDNGITSSGGIVTARQEIGLLERKKFDIDLQIKQIRVKADQIDRQIMLVKPQIDRECQQLATTRIVPTPIHQDSSNINKHDSTTESSPVLTAASVVTPTAPKDPLPSTPHTKKHWYYWLNPLHWFN